MIKKHDMNWVFFVALALVAWGTTPVWAGGVACERCTDQVGCKTITLPDFTLACELSTACGTKIKRVGLFECIVYSCHCAISVHALGATFPECRCVT